MPIITRSKSFVLYSNKENSQVRMYVTQGEFATTLADFTLYDGTTVLDLTGASEVLFSVYQTDNRNTAVALPVEISNASQGKITVATTQEMSATYDGAGMDCYVQVIYTNKVVKFSGMKIYVKKDPTPDIIAQSPNAQTLIDALNKLALINGGTGTVTVDDALSTSSANPVQNKKITAKINEIDEYLSGHSFMYDAYGRIFSYTDATVINSSHFSNKQVAETNGCYVWLCKKVTSVQSGALPDAQYIRQIIYEGSDASNLTLASEYQSVNLRVGRWNHSVFYMLATLAYLYNNTLKTGDAYSKTDSDSRYRKTSTKITIDDFATDLANLINGKEVKSNKKTTLTGNESSNDFYPTTKAVVDYVAENYESLSNITRQISFAHENNESSYDDGGVYIDDATDITKMYYVKNSNGARVGILFCVQTPGYNYASQVKIDAFGNITVRVKTKESGEANYTWKSWSPIGKNANIADDAVTIEKLQSNIRTSISNADGCALTLSRNFGISISAESVNHEYHMRADGGGEPKVGYEIRRYPVSAGQIISIYCSDSEAGCKWVFKSENTGTPATNVGNVHPNAGRWIVEVPENATYLFTSTLTGDAASEVMIIPPSTDENTNKIANVNTEASAINNTIGKQFRGTDLIPSSTNANFWLNVYGGNSQHEGYEVLRYPVTPGKTIYIRVSDSEAPAKWVFKTTDSGVTTNIVGDIHLYGGEWAVTVPDAANYLFIARQTGDTNSYAAITNFGKGHIINPCVFIYISGGKLQIECTSTARAILDNNVMNISGWSTSLDYNVNSTDAVIMTSSGFILKRADETSWGDCIIAYCYGAAYTVVSVDRYVFANAIPIDNMRKRAGVPFFVNKKRIKQYGVLTNQNFTKITDFGYFCRFNDGAIGTEPLRYATPDGNSVRNTNTLTINTSNIANKTLLCIGDSITRRGWFQDQLKTRVSSLNFVGTQTTYFGELGNIDGKYKCEGYSGRTAKNVLLDSTILLQDGTTIIPNPFYNPSTQSIDYGYYCSQQGVAPDYVIIEFGLNEDQPKQYSTAIQGFINSVKSYAPNTVVYVIQPFNGVNSDIGSANSNSEQHEIQCELCVLESRSFTDCVLIPCWYIMVDEFDYVLTESAYGYDNKMVTQFEDGVHPGLQNRGTTGFKKLGDQIYNYLGITS